MATEHLEMEQFLREATAQLNDLPPEDMIHECGADAIATLHADSGTALREADGKLHVFPFKDVRACWRRIFTDASIRLALRNVRNALSGSTTKQGENGEPNTAVSDQKASPATEPKQSAPLHDENVTAGLPGDPSWLTETVRLLDMALIMTGGCGREELIEAFFNQLERCLEQVPDRSKSPSRPAKKRLKRSVGFGQDVPATFPTTSLRIPDLEYPIKRCNMTMSAFQAHLGSNTPSPLVLQGVMDPWSSEPRHMWHSPEYLQRKTLGGRRLVPVELGRSYTDDNWGQKIVPFGKFMKEYLLADASKQDVASAENNAGIAYLAQHDLFAQIPALRKDIAIPDLCYTNPPANPTAESKPETSRKLDEPLINAWFGPAGTISPLHTDPYHNILCQIVGKKYVRLYAPSETEYLEPRGQENGIDMSNTSSIPLEVVEMGALGAEDAQEDRWDGFQTAKYVETVLSENESLYIPLGWWHYVRSLSVSCSVSFWWN